MNNKSSKKLKVARKNKKDEFYTLMSTIEDELWHYKKSFLKKIVYCNCDNPYKSNFYKYFKEKFKECGLKKLIATCYGESSVKAEFDGVNQRIEFLRGGETLEVTNVKVY